MAWTAPRTWSANETETAAIFNQAIRDNMNFVYNLRKSSGRTYRCVKAIGYTGSFTSANSNPAGGVVTYPSGYDYTAPAGMFRNAGDALIIQGLGYIPGSASETKTMTIRIGSTATTLIAANMSNAHRVIYHVIVRRNSSTGLGVFGTAIYGPATPTGCRIINGSSTVSDLATNAVTISMGVGSATATQIGLTEHLVIQSLSIE